MTARRYALRFTCGHEECRETAHYEVGTRAEQNDLFQKYGGKPSKWRCTRHSRPDEVLSPLNSKRVTEIKSERKFGVGGADIGVFWGSSGFLFGPGFKAFSKDFPEGTVLRVTAEIILPEGAP